MVYRNGPTVLSQDLGIKVLYACCWTCMTSIPSIPTPSTSSEWLFINHVVVSENRGTSQSSSLVEFSTINHPTIGVPPILGNLHICHNCHPSFLFESASWTCWPETFKGCLICRQFFRQTFWLARADWLALSHICSSCSHLLYFSPPPPRKLKLFGIPWTHDLIHHYHHKHHNHRIIINTITILHLTLAIG